MDETVTVEIEPVVEPVIVAGVPEPETTEAPSPAEQASATVAIIEAEGEAAVARIEAEGEASVAVAEVLAADQEVREDVGELQAWQGTVEGRLLAIETSLSSISGTVGEIAAAIIPPPTTQEPSETQPSAPLVNPGAADGQGAARTEQSDAVAAQPETVLRARRFKRI